MPSRIPHHDRRSVRLESWYYSWAWWYYVTLCTHDHLPFFGEVCDGMVVLSDVGRIVEKEWRRTPAVRPGVELDMFVVMPNHLHAIVILPHPQRDKSVGAHSCAPLRRIPRSLGSLIAGFKAIVTAQANACRGTPGEKLWQRGYYDHVVRDSNDLHRIRTYILNNPLRWECDSEGPEDFGETDLRSRTPPAAACCSAPAHQQ